MTEDLIKTQPCGSLERVVSRHIAERYPAELALGLARYEALRRLNPRQFQELHDRNMQGERFDHMVDALLLADNEVSGAPDTAAQNRRQSNE